jgi:1-acyl-sn-glycerol-3-phosphate acyltransferase
VFAPVQEVGIPPSWVAAMLRSFLCLLAVAVVTSALLPCAALAILVTWDTRGATWFARRLWAPAMLWVAGTRVEVLGMEHVDPTRPTLYASNHQSSIDIPVLFVALPVNLRFIAKEQLRWVPLIGWYLQLAGHILIDRSNRTSAIASLDRAAVEIALRKISLIVFPEGTRSPDGHILPFKHGSFGLALKAHIPVVPVTLEGSLRVMPRGSWRIRAGVVRVRVGAPVATDGFDVNDRAGLARVVREAVVQGSLGLGGLGGVPTDSSVSSGRGTEAANASSQPGML